MHRKELKMNKSIMKEAAKNYPGLVLPPYDAIIMHDGFDAVCAFSELLGGASVYVPSCLTIFSASLLAQAKYEFETKNVSLVALARKYGFTERHLRKMIGYRYSRRTWHS